eukprot:28221-Chlamydomonas_euryale.AAC.3
MTETDAELEAFLQRFARECGDAQVRVDELNRKVCSAHLAANQSAPFGEGQQQQQMQKLFREGLSGEGQHKLFAEG